MEGNRESDGCLNPEVDFAGKGAPQAKGKPRSTHGVPGWERGPAGQTEMRWLSCALGVTVKHKESTPGKKAEKQQPQRRKEKPE